MVATSSVENYGWDAKSPESCDYLGPEILARLHALRPRRVVDLGSGNGTLSGLMAGAGYDVVGVEVDRLGVEFARKSFPSARFYNFGVQDDPAELLASEFPGTGLDTDRGFDVAVSTEVVEHLYSPHQLPRYASRVLKPGGHLILSTPYHGYLKNLAIALLDKWDTHHTPLWHGGHIKFWSRTTLSRLFAENRFEVIGFSGVGRVPYLWKSMVLVAQRRH